MYNLYNIYIHACIEDVFGAKGLGSAAPPALVDDHQVPLRLILRREGQDNLLQVPPRLP